MKRDIDYVVKDGEVIIVDEFTGRLMIGRRYNEGLHQAIEAKEGVKVARESKTLATITFQNYFRLYNKLSGMTGTAMTEEDEFRDDLQAGRRRDPHQQAPSIRKDYPDVVYKTDKRQVPARSSSRSWSATRRASRCWSAPSPSKRARLLSQACCKRAASSINVLNAKYHEKEAEIVAQAGKFGAVTIATNMAGRGTDIMLGGNAEYHGQGTTCARHGLPTEDRDHRAEVADRRYGETDDEEILAARKPFAGAAAQVQGRRSTPRPNEVRAGRRPVSSSAPSGTRSRRIDNQLRGRAGRQGDPGETRFYLSPGGRPDAPVRRRACAGHDGYAASIDEDTPIEHQDALQRHRKRPEER